MLLGQNEIIGNVYLLNSKYDTGQRMPVVGVKVNAEGSNGAYTKSEGAYTLTFNQINASRTTRMSIGEQDQGIIDQAGNVLELVNAEKLGLVTIPKKAAAIPINIIVCPKGTRDLVAQRYYKIIKTSAAIALAKKEKEFQALQQERQKDYEQLKELMNDLVALQAQTDSLSIYEEALRIASINKDDASKRVLRYIELLDEGKSVQEARQALSIKDASMELDASIATFDAGIEELQVRADASEAILDYEDAITCYDSIIHYLEKMDVDPLKVCAYYSGQANLYSLINQNRPALACYQKVVDIRTKIIGSDHPDLAIAYIQIAKPLQTLAKYEEALAFLQKSITILEKNPGLESSSLFNAYASLGLSYEYLNQTEKALTFQKKAIRLKEEFGEEDDLNLAAIYSNISLTYKDLGDFDKSMTYVQKSIQIKERLLNPRHPDLTKTYNNLALLYSAMGQHEEALEIQLRTMKMDAETFGAESQYMLVVYHNLATIYKELKDLDNAFIYQEKCIKILEHREDLMHPDVAVIHINMAVILEKLGKYEQALVYGLKSLEARKILLDAQDILLPQTYDVVALIYLKLEKYKESVDCFSQSIKQVKGMEGESTYLGKIYDNRAVVHRQAKAYRSSLEDYQKAIAIWNRMPSLDHRNLFTSYRGIALTYKALEDYNQAIVYCKKSIAVVEQLLEAKQKDPNVLYKLATAYNDLGLLLDQQEKEEEALLYYEKSMFIKEDILPEDHLDRGVSYYNVSLAYNILGDFQKAKIYHDKCASIFEKQLPADHLNRRMTTRLLHRIYHREGIHFYDLGDYKKAIEVYQKAAQVPTNEPLFYLHNNMGMTYAKLNLLEEARVEFVKFEKLHASDEHCYRNWAVYYALQGKPQKALFSIQKAVDMGYNDLAFLNSDATMDAIRSMKEYRDLVKKVKKANRKKE